MYGGQLAKFANPAILAVMPTRNISLTREQDAYIDDVVRSGAYQNASEAVRDAVRALQQRRNQDALKLRLLRAQLDLGIADLKNGDYDEVSVDELGEYLSKLSPVASARAKQRPRKSRR